MKILKILVILIFLGLSLWLGFTAFNNYIYNQKQGQTNPALGGDRDEHGCIPSAGYSWCEAKQNCLRVWEEPCVSETDLPEAEALESEIKDAIVAKYGPSAQSLNITVSKLSGDYAQGGASEEGLGGGMWFAAKAGGKWQLVWDGNGIITCDDIADYPDFPDTMIPQCFDESTEQLIER